MKDTTIAVDLAKNVFEIAISREAGKVFKQLRVSRPKLVSFFCETERCHRASRSLRLGSLLGKDVATVGRYVATRLRAVVQVRKRPGCGPQYGPSPIPKPKRDASSSG